MTLHRRDKPSPNDPPPTRWQRFLGALKTCTAYTSLVTLAVAFLLHGVVMLRAQYQLQPRIVVDESRLGKLEAFAQQLSPEALDKHFVPREEIDRRRAERDKEDQEFHDEIVRVEAHFDSLETAVTSLAMRH